MQVTARFGVLRTDSRASLENITERTQSYSQTAVQHSQPAANVIETPWKRQGREWAATKNWLLEPERLTGTLPRSTTVGELADMLHAHWLQKQHPPASNEGRVLEVLHMLGEVDRANVLKGFPSWARVWSLKKERKLWLLGPFYHDMELSLFAPTPPR